MHRDKKKKVKHACEGGFPKKQRKKMAAFCLQERFLRRRIGRAAEEGNPKGRRGRRKSCKGIYTVFVCDSTPKHAWKKRKQTREKSL